MHTADSRERVNVESKNTECAQRDSYSCFSRINKGLDQLMHRRGQVNKMEGKAATSRVTRLATIRQGSAVTEALHNEVSLRDAAGASTRTDTHISMHTADSRERVNVESKNTECAQRDSYSCFSRINKGLDQLMHRRGRVNKMEGKAATSRVTRLATIRQGSAVTEASHNEVSLRHAAGAYKRTETHKVQHTAVPWGTKQRKARAWSIQAAVA
jgi:hypothetical protein